MAMNIEEVKEILTPGEYDDEDEDFDDDDNFEEEEQQIMNIYDFWQNRFKLNTRKDYNNFDLTENTKKIL